MADSQHRSQQRPNSGSHRGRRPKRTIDKVRLAAFEAMSEITGQGAYANLVGPAVINHHQLSGRDAALATELINGTCRALGTYEMIIEEASGRDTRDLDPDVVDVLCLGTHQLLGMRTPPHAAIDTTVNLAGAVVGERVVGLVNAILRKITRHDLDGWTSILAEGLTGADELAVRHLHPRWIAHAYADLLPAEEVGPALAANNVAAVPTLVARPGLSTVEELVAEGATAVGPSPYAASYKGNPADLLAVREGRAAVQDAGSQLVATALARAEAPEGWWLDLCAGPGGKAGLLTGLAAERDERLLAVEVAPHRAELVARTLRAHVTARPVTICADGTSPAWRQGRFARVMADVPCSGLGALRRRPESRWRRTPDDVTDLIKLQQDLLNSAIEAAQPGGVIAYVTCSPHADETAGVVEAVLAERKDLELIDAPSLLPEVTDAALGSYVQLWPHRHGTDAMFLALLRRRS